MNSLLASGAAAISIAIGRTRCATDDEILGLVQAPKRNKSDEPQSDGNPDADSKSLTGSNSGRTKKTLPRDLSAEGLPENHRMALEESLERRAAWQDAQEYRKTFEIPRSNTPGNRSAGGSGSNGRTFYSRKPDDHAELARAIAGLDTDAFVSLVRAIEAYASNSQMIARPRNHALVKGNAGREASLDRSAAPEAQSPIQEAQLQFFHATNAAAGEGVLDAIESQVARLLPDGISKSERNRVVGEIYRELDATLQSNRQLASQMREAFRTGALDADH